MPVNSGIYEIILTNGYIITAYSNDLRGIFHSYVKANEKYIWIIQENAQVGKTTCIRNDLVLYFRFPEEMDMEPI